MPAVHAFQAYFLFTSPLPAWTLVLCCVLAGRRETGELVASISLSEAKRCPLMVGPRAQLQRQRRTTRTEEGTSLCSAGAGDVRPVPEESLAGEPRTVRPGLDSASFNTRSHGLL